jgi:hypothetical protein
MRTLSRVLLVVLALAGALALAAQVSPEWAVSFGEAGYADETGGFTLAFDATGNLYVSGSYYSSISFGSHTLSSPQPGWAQYVAKKSPGGDWLWAATADGDMGSFGRNYVDPWGNCFLYGQYNGTLNLGPFTIVNPYPTEPYQRPHGYWAQLDPAGNWQWAENVPMDYVSGLWRDFSGNYFLCGYVRDPLNDIHDTKAIKLDPARQPVWNTLVGTDLFSRSIQVDDAGGIHYVCDFNYLLLNPAGSVVQSVQLPGAFKDFALAPDGSKYYRGFLSEPGSFGDIPFSGGGFLAKMGAGGTTWEWVEPEGSLSLFYEGGVAVDNTGGVFISGDFTGTRTFGELTLANTGGEDLYIAKISSDGVWQWAKQGGGSTYSDKVRTNGLEVDASGNIYPWGTFQGNVEFGISQLATGSSSESNRFIALMKQPTLTLLTPEPGDVWPLGTTQTVTWDYEGKWDPKILAFFLRPQAGPSDPIYIGSADADDETIPAPVAYPNLTEGDYELEGVLVYTTVRDSVPISIDWPACLPPESVHIQVVGADKVITWDPVTQNVNGQPQTPSGYQVYMSGNPDAGFFPYTSPVTECSFTDYDGGPYRRFYRVKAIYNGPGE